MHEQARLACPFPAVGKGVGDLVSISEVKTHYATSDAANSALSFACADCNVPVSARIIQNYVQDRKVTPSSGFRASDRKQPHTCNREPSFIEASLAASGAAAAHSSQRGAPERWVDPRKAAPNTGTTTSTPSSASASVGSASRGRNGPAVGQSVGQSQTVEKFARGKARRWSLHGMCMAEGVISAHFIRWDISPMYRRERRQFTQGRPGM